MSAEAALAGEVPAITSKPSHPRVLLDVVEEHFEELDFLWQQREQVIFAPDWTRGELVALEARAEAHLDALRIAEDHAVDLARPALAGAETFAATAATLVLLERGGDELCEEVLVALEKAGAPETRHGIRIGLRHAGRSRLHARLLALAAGPDLELAAAAADVLAFQRVPVRGLERLLTAEAPESRALAFDALGRLGGLGSPGLLEAGLADASTSVRTAALRAAARCGLPALARRCRDHAAPEALAFLGVLGDAADRPRLEAATADPQRAAAAFAGLGALGCAEAVPLLLERMADPRFAAAAAAAFVRISGAQGLEADAPAPAPAPREAADDEARIEAEFADADRPVDPARARAWWQARGGRFAGGGRWQAGRQVGNGPPAADEHSLAIRRDLWLAARARDVAATPDLELEARGAGSV